MADSDRKLPMLLSSPHAGLHVPPEARRWCALEPEDIRADGDEQAEAIYDLANEVDFFVTTHVARAIVDVNRSEDDRAPDGVVKTQTCWNVPVYSEFPPPGAIEKLLELYYRLYHGRLSEIGRSGLVRFGVDCHTMAAFSPPGGAGPEGIERPSICLGDVEGMSFPREWTERLARCLERATGEKVALNDPFRGGYITRSHASEMPWVQIELSRAPFLTVEQKREAVRTALREFCEFFDIE